MFLQEVINGSVGVTLCDVLGRFLWSSQAGGIAQMSPSSPGTSGRRVMWQGCWCAVGKVVCCDEKRNLT